MEGLSLKEKLIILSDELAQEVYPLTYKFPQQEMYALGDQLRRSIISVPANIIEGVARAGNKEFKHFLNIAYGSLKEAKYLLNFAYKQNLIEKNNYLSVEPKVEELCKLIYVFIKKLSSP